MQRPQQQQRHNTNSFDNSTAPAPSDAASLSNNLKAFRDSMSTLPQPLLSVFLPEFDNKVAANPNLHASVIANQMADDIHSLKWDLRGSVDPVLAKQAANLIRALMLARKDAAASPGLSETQGRAKGATPAAMSDQAEGGEARAPQQQQENMQETLANVLGTGWDGSMEEMIGGSAEGEEKDEERRDEVAKAGGEADTKGQKAEEGEIRT